MDFDFDFFVWKNWCVDKEITDEIENYEPAELNTFLEHFYAEVNNKKGEDYEPESLKVMMASLDRHLKNKGCTLSLVRDREFSSSKEVLEDKVKQLRFAGRGTGNPGSVIVPQYGSSKITVFVWGKNIILKFLGNTK